MPLSNISCVETQVLYSNLKLLLTLHITVTRGVNSLTELLKLGIKCLIVMCFFYMLPNHLLRNLLY
jgi:hypothetical protein